MFVAIGKFLYINTLFDPECFNIQTLPAELKRTVTKKYQGIKELNSITGININHYINLTRDYFKKECAFAINDCKKIDKCRSFVTKCKEINQQLKKFKNIKILVANNLFSNYGSPGLTLDKTIILDRGYVTNTGLIMHEICHAINNDCRMCFAFGDLLNQQKAESRSKKITELYRNFLHKVEKRADLWSASQGKNFAKTLLRFFQYLKKSNTPYSTEAHPSLKERISYLK